MSNIIKKNPVSEDLARCVARLQLANKNLDEKMRGRDFPAIMMAMKIVKSSIYLFQEVSKKSSECYGNATAAALGVALLCESYRLCNEASEGFRLFFEVIPGGKTSERPNQ